VEFTRWSSYRVLASALPPLHDPTKRSANLPPRLVIVPRGRRLAYVVLDGINAPPHDDRRDRMRPFGMRGDRDGASVSGPAFIGNWAGCPTRVFQRVELLTSRHPNNFSFPFSIFDFPSFA
jgi:hypothetical protein